MPSWRPATATDPDGENEWRFHDLDAVDPETARHLIGEYGRVWLTEAGLSQDHLPEVGDTVALVVADEWGGSDSGAKRLRLTSWYTGSTYYLPEWDGDLHAAILWIRHIAQLQAVNVQVERVKQGSTPWDLT